MLAAVSHADETAGKKIYECRFVDNAPYGVAAWAASTMVKERKNRENRFVDYNSDAATGLILDANTERTTDKDVTVSPRETAFYSVYDEKGWYLYIEASEPLIKDLVDQMVDPKSAGRNEGYEIFFVPGMHGKPYYQIFTKPFSQTTNYIDWGVDNRHYRTLDGLAKVESLPLENGYGTFMFVPWEAVYEEAPLKGDLWRFSIIRWMPFAKAGGVTWGGTVHDTGDFGLMRFAKPTGAQKAAMERRLLRVAWFKYLAVSKDAAAVWSDVKMGDPKFYDDVLKPVIEKNNTLGEGLGKPETWSGETVTKAAGNIPEWMEFRYTVSDLRSRYLMNEQFNTGQ